MRGAESLQMALLIGFQHFPLVKFYYSAHYFRYFFRVVGQEMGHIFMKLIKRFLFSHLLYIQSLICGKERNGK